MPLTDTQVLERFNEQELSHARIDERVKVVETSHRDVWTTINEMRQMITSVRIQVAAIVAIGGFAQAILTAFIVYKITKG